MNRPADPVSAVEGLRPYSRRRVSEGFRDVMKVGASILEVARAAVWLFGEERNRLKRIYLFHRSSGESSSGGEIRADRYPRYFRALTQDPLIAANNVHEDHRTAQFSEAYSGPYGINSWVDAPIEVEGVLVGVVRFEHVGPPRNWREDEKRVAQDLGSLLGALLDSCGLEVSPGAVEETRAPPPGPSLAEEAPPEEGERRGPEGPVLEDHGRPFAGPEGEEPSRRAVSPEETVEGFPADALPVGLLRVTVEGELLHATRYMARLLGLEDPESLTGRYLSEFFQPPAGWQTLASQVQRTGEVTGHETKVRRPDGATTWLLLNATLAPDDPSDETLLVSAMDIRERKSTEDRLLRQAHRDPLTGAANRRLFRETADQVFALADRRERRAGILYVDLRRFKEINDRYGHEVGDRVLVHVADRLRARGRESDLTARIGGDEFAVLLAEVEGLEGARTAAERARDSLKRPIQLDDLAVRVDATVGVALYPDHGRDIRTILKRADVAMYRAKKAEETEIAIATAEEAEDGG